jgi:DNA polymerase-3 subunit gamma/tau
MAENFIVSARKYRPDTWESVVGQKNITSTLQNAIANDQIAQAYLFTGPRGVGKTTCARLFAKAVNNSIGTDMDELQFNIFELDAASNNSVDDIRGIVDSVRIPPQVGKYKVYIIDEVHMLSQAAFNAFLKTLEEPPAHAVFILATTEKHKIIPTILSRCQIFDFNRIKIKDMTEHLAYVASQEGITAEMDALHVISQKADGAMRDALSIFDQVVAFCGRNLTYKDVIQNLNVLDYDYYFRLTDIVLQEDIPAALVLFDEVLNKGFDGHHFITGLGGHFRNLMVSKDPQTVALLELSESVAERYKSQGAAADIRLLIEGLKLVNECDTQYRSSKHQRLLVELTLMKLASILYNHREGEKKKFKLKPFRAREVHASQAAARPSTPAPSSGVSSQPVTAEKQGVSIATPVTPKLGKMDLIRKSSASISYKNVMQRNTQAQNSLFAEAEAEQKEKPTRDYNEGEIVEAWRIYASEHLNHNKQVQSAFQIAQIELKENNVLIASFPSESTQMYFDENRSGLAEYMRNNHDIRGLEIHTKILRPDEIKSTYKTSKQRFDELVEKYPALETARKRFNLQVDF